MTYKSINAKMKKFVLLISIIPTLVALVGCSTEYQEYTEEIPEEFLTEQYFSEEMIAGQCNADCNKPRHNKTNIICFTTKSCQAVGCVCHLYRLSKTNPNPKWEKLPKKKKGHPYEPTKYIYRCWCVN